jgi:hypothetical protein
MTHIEMVDVGGSRHATIGDEHLAITGEKSPGIRCQDIKLKALVPSRDEALTNVVRN